MQGMSTSYIAYQPEQQHLLPSALQDWLPQGHLAYFISDTVGSLNLSAFHTRYASGGPRNQPFHPAMMVEVLVYAYATGVFSSRKIAKKLHEDVAFRVLAAENLLAHRTIRGVCSRINWSARPPVHRRSRPVHAGCYEAHLTAALLLAIT